jgi:phosphoserine phosphatase RsbU/P
MQGRPRSYNRLPNILPPARSSPSVSPPSLLTLPHNDTLGTVGITKILDKERPNAQLELKDRALAASAEGITIADATLPDNPLIYANAGFERLTGYSVAEVLGRNCRFLQGAATDSDTVDLLRTAIREKREVTVQLRNYRKDGTPFWNRLSITPVLDGSGTVTHFIGVQSDVTEEKEAKDALQRANTLLEEANQATRRDLEAAAAVQNALLPAKLPQFPGFQFAYRFHPCIDVGGDSLNVLALDDRHAALYILDVSGHGVAAALLSVTLTHMLSLAADRSFLYQTDVNGDLVITPPADVVSRLNEHFVANAVLSRYFTMIYGILDRQSCEFRYVAAGHPGPIHVTGNAPPLMLETGGIPVGLISGATYEESVVTLAPGDRLYLCTDGISEAENEREEHFGLGRLMETLSETRTLSLNASLAAIVEKAEAWSSQLGAADDASILALERT